MENDCASTEPYTSTGYGLSQGSVYNNMRGQIIGGKEILPPTVGENINNQIEMHRNAIARLEATKSNLAKANMLDLKISDLREAMNY